jgi:hypothetical protein
VYPTWAVHTRLSGFVLVTTQGDRSGWEVEEIPLIMVITADQRSIMGKLFMSMVYLRFPLFCSTQKGLQFLAMGCHPLRPLLIAGLFPRVSQGIQS